MDMGTLNNESLIYKHNFANHNFILDFELLLLGIRK